ncbi:hypothetical protein NEMIN01_0866 [Nematocida minor]|uniref:uncharacterized protein n=1 Tax=Nematocida minor TaxID=1912983 RepID=UPI0022202896|nr:uncharacterized protein NEMIN01_0866 [Nematocida minor]KAI5190081.1 hypothetical protein NEMIN01_0866 [Nematocida minor]
MEGPIEDHQRDQAPKAFALAQMTKKCGRYIAKVPKSAGRKIKKGVTYLAKKIKTIFRTLKGKKIGEKETNYDEEKETERMKASSTTDSALLKTAKQNAKCKIQITSQGEALPEIIQPIEAESSKKSTVETIAYLCKQMEDMERIIKDKTHSEPVPASISLELISYMEKNGIGRYAELNEIKTKYHADVRSQKDKEDVKLVNSTEARSAVIDELKPTLYLKYMFAQSSEFRKSYSSLYDSIIFSLAAKAAPTNRSITTVLLYASVVKQIKMHIMSSTCKLESKKPIFDLYTYKKHEYIQKQRPSI